jgi:hypothetical protein
MNALGWNYFGVSGVIEHITEELWLCQLGMLKKEQSMPEGDFFFECLLKDIVYLNGLWLSNQ